ncbi:chorismate-binding protein [Leptolyngbya sp. 15MV]|nr:chorismate-binding protein [Leptolyngbya sp. 15MV]
MADRAPFVLLDDARAEGAADAHLFEDPREIFVARRPGEVAEVLARADAARAGGGTLAGYIAYEAGLALEPRLAALAGMRSGAAGPLVWLGLFDGEQILPAGDVPQWLAARGGGEASLGPLDPQLSFGGYARAFARLQEAIRAGDIYQANLTFPLAGSYRGDELALYRQLRPAAGAGYGGVVFDGKASLAASSAGTAITGRPCAGGAGGRRAPSSTKAASAVTSRSDARPRASASSAPKVAPGRPSKVRVTPPVASRSRSAG